MNRAFCSVVSRSVRLLPSAVLCLAATAASTARADEAPLPPLPPPGPNAPPPTPSAPPEAPKVRSDADWAFPQCNGVEPEATVKASTGCVGVFGLRGSIGDVQGAPAVQGIGLMFSAEGEEYWRRHVFSTRGQYRLALGGGGAGLEGALMGSGAFGFRIPVTKEEGPVIRAGMAGYVLGDDAFYSSLLELPQLQLGWQWSEGHALVEIAAQSGAALTGRFRAGAIEPRRIGQGLTYGGHASLQIPWVRLSLEAERLPASDGLDAVDSGMATLCAVAAPFAICADARVEQAHATFAGAEPFVRATYGGLTLGLTGER